MIRGDRLKKIRLEKQLTQKQLGDLVNITKVSICGYEKGIRTPNLETLLDLCNALNTSFDYLLGIEVNVVMEENESYNFKMSSEEIQLIKELRKRENLHKQLISDPKRTIELISVKLK